MNIRIAGVLLVCLIGRVAIADVVVDQESVGSCCTGYLLDYPGTILLRPLRLITAGN